ncbi:hypothetical protein Droror1_Dr00021228 [Drosera rotundifolia]
MLWRSVQLFELVPLLTIQRYDQRPILIITICGSHSDTFSTALCTGETARSGRTGGSIGGTSSDHSKVTQEVRRSILLPSTSTTSLPFDYFFMKSPLERSRRLHIIGRLKKKGFFCCKFDMLGIS